MWKNYFEWGSKLCPFKSAVVGEETKQFWWYDFLEHNIWKKKAPQLHRNAFMRRLGAVVRFHLLTDHED